MAKPQQPELRRSGFVPALDPDATESRLEAHDRPTAKGGKRGPIPDEQQPGHHPDEEQDKPDLDRFAERLGVVPEGEEPADAPHVEDAPDVEDDASTVSRVQDGPSTAEAGEEEPPKDSTAAAGTSAQTDGRRSFSPIGLALLGPVTTVQIVRRVVRRILGRK